MRRMRVRAQPRVDLHLLSFATVVPNRLWSMNCSTFVGEKGFLTKPPCFNFLAPVSCRRGARLPGP